MYNLWTISEHWNILTHSQTSPGFYVSTVQVFWEHCEKRRNCSERAISPFPSVFSNHLDNFFVIFTKSENCHLQTHSVWKSLKFVIWERINLAIMTGCIIYTCYKFQWYTKIKFIFYHMISYFNDPEKEPFGNYSGKRSKCWKPIYFFFSCNVSCHSRNQFQSLINIYNGICECCQFRQA